LRVIKPSSKLNRQPQPRIKSGKIAKAEKNNYSNYVAWSSVVAVGQQLAVLVHSVDAVFSGSILTGE
jgi:hypothetical protein